MTTCDPPANFSAITRIGLENGVYRDPALAAIRRSALDVILRNIPTVEFGEPEIEAYRNIVATVGHSRRKTLDRMIAASALVHRLTLVTSNGADFADIPGLELEAWPAA